MLGFYGVVFVLIFLPFNLAEIPPSVLEHAAPQNAASQTAAPQNSDPLNAAVKNPAPENGAEKDAHPENPTPEKAPEENKERGEEFGGDSNMWVIVSTCVSLVGSVILFLGLKLFAEFRREVDHSAFEKRNQDIPAAGSNSHTMEYFAYKDHLFERFGEDWEDIPSTGQEEDEDPANHAANRWLRKIGAEEKKQLKSLLLRRAIATIPLFQKIKKDRQGKFQLYRRDMMAFRHFEQIENAFTDVIEEMKDVQYEAEAIQTEWGEHILAHAAAIYKRQVEKVQREQEILKQERENEKKIKQLEKQKEIQLAREEEQIQKQKRLADKAAQELIAEIAPKQT